MWLIASRALRGFADGLTSILLASILTRLGFTAFQVGAVVTATLLGSAALTLATGLLAHRVKRRIVLFSAAALMVATGLGFAGFTSFWPLLVVGFIGTVNPTAGDVTLFLPTEQAVLSETVHGTQRTEMFAWYNLAGSLAGALGALCAAAPAWLALRLGVSALSAERGGFILYSCVGMACAILYRNLSPVVEHSGPAPATALAQSRGVVLKLSALFSLDSFGGGFVVQSLLALWLWRRFALPVSTAAAVFFAMGLLSAFSQLVSGRLAGRIGHVRTMVYTHLPANLFLMLAGVMPNAALAVTFLLLRMSLSQMDVPARQAFVMAVVPREERAAAASVTNVPRSLASALSPMIAGFLLDRTAFGWPLLCGGLLKAVYDLLLFANFSKLRPREDA